MELYFAYGSNLSTERMTARCPSAEVFSRAVLHGFRLCFPRTHRNWPGGVAGIVSSPGDDVEGVLYRLSAEDLLTLDGFENVAGGSYVRQRLELETPNGRIESAWVYIAQPIEGGPFPPSRRYLGTILIGAREHRLPEGYVRKLESFLGSWKDAAGADQDG
jgi:gamma-glutamylcyclotransferase (GGCT)/AIG2-like uncharacterized protein YtfP